jgi:plastocyanin
MRALLVLATIAFAGCTYGAPSASGTGLGAGVTTIDVSLTAHAASATSAGTSGGYAPAALTIPVGSHVQFLNADSFAHTASLVSNAQTFPTSSPLGASALSAAGTTLSSAWSSGNLTAGARSPVLLADRPGTYLYGCFYHYGAPMRGAIVVR